MIENVAMMPLQELGEDVGDKIITDINGLLPNILYAVVIAVLGFVAATIISGRVAGFINRMDVSERANDSVFGDMFLGERQRLGDLVGTLVSLYIYLLTAFLIANELQLGRVAGALDGVIGFIPTAALALLVIGVGIWLADLVKDRVADSAPEGGDRMGEMFGLGIQAFVYLIAVIVGFSVLAGTSGGAGFAIPIMQVFALGFALAFILAIGIGAREYLDTGDEESI